MDDKKLEIKGYFVYIDGKLIKPKIVKLDEVDCFPMKVNSSEIAFVDNVVFEEENYVYRIVVIPSKYIGKYLNRIPPMMCEKPTYLQLLRGKAKIESFYEKGNGRYFYNIENMVNENTYVIEKGSCYGIINNSYEKCVVLIKSPKNFGFCSPIYFIGKEGYEQNPEKLVFGEKKIEKKEYSLIKELMSKI